MTTITLGSVAMVTLFIHTDTGNSTPNDDTASIYRWAGHTQLIPHPLHLSERGTQFIPHPLHVYIARRRHTVSAMA